MLGTCLLDYIVLYCIVAVVVLVISLELAAAALVVISRRMID